MLDIMFNFRCSGVWDFFYWCLYIDTCKNCKYAIDGVIGWIYKTYANLLLPDNEDIQDSYVVDMQLIFVDVHDNEQIDM